MGTVVALLAVIIVLWVHPVYNPLYKSNLQTVLAPYTNLLIKPQVPPVIQATQSIVVIEPNKPPPLAISTNAGTPQFVHTVGKDPVAKPFIPGPPKRVEASAGKFRDKIRLDWAPVGKAEGYQIWRQRTGSSEPAALLVEVMRDTYYYEDYTAGNGMYAYGIRSKNAAGISGFSRLVQGWRLSLDAPESLFVSDRTYPDRIYIYWTPVQGAMDYELWRQRLSQFSPPIDDIAGINEDWIQQKVVAADDAQQIAILTKTEMEDMRVETNVAYAYRVLARDAIGGASAFTPWQQGSIRPISTALSTPAWVSATAGDFTDRIRITWDIAPGQRYEVFRSTIDNNGTCRSINWSTSGPDYEDFDVVPRQVYYYWVRSGDGGQSLSLFSPSASGYSASRE